MTHFRPFADHESRVTSYESRVTSHESRVTSHGLSGNIVILTAFATPVLIVALLFLIDTGRILSARARLESAADRAAYAGAATLTHGMNEIARENFLIHKAWRDLARDFGADTQQNKEAANQRIARYEAARDLSLEKISAIREKMLGRASEIALGLLEKNAPHSEGEVSVRGDVVIESDLNPSEQWGSVAYDYVTGPVYGDPESVESGEYRGLKFLMKRRAPDAALTIIARQDVHPLLLEKMIGPKIPVGAMSAGQAFGGSLELFARKDFGSPEEAAAMKDDAGFDALYHTVLIPSRNHIFPLP